MEGLIRRDGMVDNLWIAFNKLDTSQFQIRLINGEPGTGKSVIVKMFLDELMEKYPENVLIATGFCNLPSEYNIPYKPFRELLKQLFEQIKVIQDREQKTGRERVKNIVSFSLRVLLKNAPDLIGNLLPGGGILKDISQSILDESDLIERLNTRTNQIPEQVSESKIIEQFIAFVKELSSQYPLVLFIDDLQWIDTPSQNLLYQMLIELRQYRVLFLGCYRSTDLFSSLESRTPMEKLINEIKISFGNVFITLDKLSEIEQKEFMNRLLDMNPNNYDGSFRKEMFRKTQGNPLFVIELVNLFLEERAIRVGEDGVWVNTENLDWHAYPIRIEGIIRERIGKLEDSLVETLSHASVQGTRFIVQVLSKTMGESERELLMNLSQKLQKQHHLVTEGECVRKNNRLVSKFYFSNYIFQQYLYEELSLTQRMLLHGDIAVIMEDLYNDNLEEVAGDIAYHYEMSGEYEKAVKYMQMMADSMIRISAFREAIPVLQNALHYLDDEMGGGNELLQLQLLSKLCTCYYSVNGWGASETEEIYRRLEHLRDKTGCRDYDEMITFGLWTIYIVRLDFQNAIRVMEYFHDQVKTDGNIPIWETVCVSLANTYFWTGEVRKVRSYLDELAELSVQYPLNLQNRALSSLLLTNLLFKEGRYEDAVKERDYMMHEFTSVSDLFIQAMGWQVVAWHAFFNGEFDLCNEAGKKMLEISEKYSFSFYVGIGKIFVAGSLPPCDYEQAIKLADEGYQSLLLDKKSEDVLAHSLFKYVKGSILFRAGYYQLCLDLLVETVLLCQEKGELCYVPDFYILIGECYRSTSRTDEARRYILLAKEAAEKQGSIHICYKCESLLVEL